MFAVFNSYGYFTEMKEVKGAEEPNNETVISTGSSPG